MTRPDSVKRALAALVSTPAYRVTIAEASDATADLADAARFADAGGLTRLRRAREVAARRNDAEAIAAAARALATFERYRDAADYHFRSGHGTVLPPDGKETIE